MRTMLAMASSGSSPCRSIRLKSDSALITTARSRLSWARSPGRSAPRAVGQRGECVLDQAEAQARACVRLAGPDDARRDQGAHHALAAEHVPQQELGDGGDARDRVLWSRWPLRALRPASGSWSAMASSAGWPGRGSSGRRWPRRPAPARAISGMVTSRPVRLVRPRPGRSPSGCAASGWPGPPSSLSSPSPFRLSVRRLIGVCRGPAPGEEGAGHGAWESGADQSSSGLTTLSTKSPMAPSTAPGCSICGKWPASAIGAKWPLAKDSA